MKLRFFERDICGQPMFVDGTEHVECLIKSVHSNSDVCFRVLYNGPVWDELRREIYWNLAELAGNWDGNSATVYLQPDMDVCIGDGCCGLIFVSVPLHNGELRVMQYNVRLSESEVVWLAKMLIDSSPQQAGMNPGVHAMQKRRAQKLLTKLGK